MVYNQPDSDLLTIEGNKLKQVENFKYLGAWIQSSEKDMEVRIGQAWGALNKMEKVSFVQQLKVFYCMELKHGP